MKVFRSLLLTLLLIMFPGIGSYLKKGFEQFSMIEDNVPDGPLFLTPYIEAGRIRKAQHLARVKPKIGNITSFSGFLTTNKFCKNNLFFWFFPAQQDWESAPLVSWLQGGPGSTSMFGLFEEIGPFNSFPDGLQEREYSWNIKNNLVFFDQPVGTGYSFTDNNCYATNETMIGADMYNALVQFLKLFPKLQKNKFFLTGESFAGHYIPAIGYIIHKNNPSAPLKINLAGLMIGDGWMDPREQINYADYVYQLGLIDDSIQNHISYYQNLFVTQVDNKNWTNAYNTWHIILRLYHENAGISVYNYLPQPTDQSNWDQFIQLPSTRKSIHVGSLEFDKQSQEAHDHLIEDFVQSVKSWVEVLLEAYPILFYAGQVDVICAYPMMINFLRSLEWSGQQQYLNATRIQWYEKGEIAGYVKGYHHLYEVLVRDAGHLVPADQPFWAYQLVNAFTSGNFNTLLPPTK